MQLIEAKNKLRKQNPAAFASLIKIDTDIKNNLRKAGLELDSIPEEGKQIFLTQKSNLSSGGDTVDVTDELTGEMRAAAVQAIEAVPGLVQGGVDMIIDWKNNRIAIIEINSQAGAGMHLFPVHGKARDIPKAIIDYYFPETAKKEINKEKIQPPNFNYQNIRNMLLYGKAKEIEVAPTPGRDLDVKQFHIIRPAEDNNYADWVQRKATELNLNGFVRQTANDTFSIVIMGGAGQIREFQEYLETRKPENLKINSKTNPAWNKQIEAGFEIKERSSTAKLLQLEQALEKEQRTRQRLEKKIQEQVKNTAEK